MILVDGAENTPAAWTRRATEEREPWRACGWSRESQAARFAKIAATLELRPHESVLDFGCGTGDFATYAAMLGVTYLGHDWSLGMVERARAAHGDLPGVRFDTVLPATATWDAIVCCGPFNLADNWSKQQTWALMRMLWGRCRRVMAVSLYYGSDPGCIRYPASEVAATAGALSESWSVERWRRNDLLVVLRRNA